MELIIMLVALALFVVGIIIAVTQRNWVVAAVLIVLSIIVFVLRDDIASEDGDIDNDGAAVLVT